MTSKYDDDEWSDSDDEGLSEVETSVLLGIPDGEIQEAVDVTDPSVSRMGGLPVSSPVHNTPWNVDMMESGFSSQ